MKKLLKSLLAVMLISMMAISFVSCGAKPADVGAKLEEAGYTVVVAEGEDAAEEADAEGATAFVGAQKGLTSYVSIVWFDNADDAEKAEAEAKEALTAMGDLAAGFSVERKGKVVIAGTATAVEDAKKAL